MPIKEGFIQTDKFLGAVASSEKLYVNFRGLGLPRNPNFSMFFEDAPETPPEGVPRETCCAFYGFLWILGTPLAPIGPLFR